ncbi:hypothetical protein AtNW77_Chr5g0154751 [Arabidopsis thaliana]
MVCCVSLWIEGEDERVFKYSRREKKKKMRMRTKESLERLCCVHSSSFDSDDYSFVFFPSLFIN